MEPPATVAAISRHGQDGDEDGNLAECDEAGGTIVWTEGVADGRWRDSKAAIGQQCLTGAIRWNWSLRFAPVHATHSW